MRQSGLSRSSGIGILVACVMVFNLIFMRTSRSNSDGSKSTANLERAPLFSNTTALSEIPTCKAPEVVIEGETAEFWHMEDPQVLLLCHYFLQVRILAFCPHSAITVGANHYQTTCSMRNSPERIGADLLRVRLINHAFRLTSALCYISHSASTDMCASLYIYGARYAIDSIDSKFISNRLPVY
jgi:hypothetical protein